MSAGWIGSGQDAAQTSTASTTGTVIGWLKAIWSKSGAVSQPSADSTTATLAASGTYTGAAFSTLNARGIIGSIYADQIGTAEVQQSPDGTNWDLVRKIAYNGTGKGRSFSVPVFSPAASQARIVFNNGPTAQGAFRFSAWTTPQAVEDDPSPMPFLATSGFAITAGSTTFAPTKAIEATTAAGTAAVTFADGTTATIYLILGVSKPVSVTNVASSGTTATGIVGYY